MKRNEAQNRCQKRSETKRKDAKNNIVVLRNEAKKGSKTVYVSLRLEAKKNKKRKWDTHSAWWALLSIAARFSPAPVLENKNSRTGSGIFVIVDYYD